VSGFRFRPAQRLRAPKQFTQVYNQGRRLGNECFSANVWPNSQGVARLGLSIAARTVGNAVHRNRIRRAIRETFRLHQNELPALDIVIGARALARDALPARLNASLTKLWKKIATECAT
jgi:ribonuclease P protein component